MKKNILVDASNIFHRSQAIFGMGVNGEFLTTKDNYPTGFIYGVFNMLSDWVGEIHSPDNMYIFLDGKPVRRLAIFPDYKKKEDRDTTAPGYDNAPEKELCDGYIARSPMGIVLHLFEALGLDQFRHPQEEADDLIASFVVKHPDDINIIISSDIDFYQLFSFNERVIIYRPGIPGDRFFDKERAREHLKKKFKVDLSPTHIRMFKALTGDPSDGIVGIPRLRKKVAAPLCHHPNVDSLYASGLPGFSKNEKKKAIDLRDKIKENFELIKLRTDIDLESYRIPGNPNHKLASRILKEDLDIHSVFAHTFSFSKSGKMRTSDAPINMIPDFLSDL